MLIKLDVCKELYYIAVKNKDWGKGQEYAIEEMTLLLELDEDIQVNY